MTQPSKVALMAQSLIRSSGLEKMAQDIVAADLARRGKTAADETVDGAQDQPYVDESGTKQTPGSVGDWWAQPGFHHLAKPLAIGGGITAAGVGGTRAAIGFGSGLGRGMMNMPSVNSEMAKPMGNWSELASRTGARLFRSRSAQALGQGVGKGFKNRATGALAAPGEGTTGGLEGAGERWAQNVFKRNPSPSTSTLNLGKPAAPAASSAAAGGEAGAMDVLQEARGSSGRLFGTAASEAAAPAERTGASAFGRLAARRAGGAMAREEGGFMAGDVIGKGLGLAGGAAKAVAGAPLAVVQMFNEDVSPEQGSFENDALARDKARQAAQQGQEGRAQQQQTMHSLFPTGRAKFAPAPRPAPAAPNRLFGNPATH